MFVIFLDERNHQETLAAVICDEKDKKNRTANLKRVCISARCVAVVLGKFQTFIN